MLVKSNVQLLKEIDEAGKLLEATETFKKCAAVQKLWTIAISYGRPCRRRPLDPFNRSRPSIAPVGKLARPPQLHVIEDFSMGFSSPVRGGWASPRIAYAVAQDPQHLLPGSPQFEVLIGSSFDDVAGAG